MNPKPRLGWQLIAEGGRSLCKHWLPVNKGHAMSNTCWCEPALQGEPLLNPPYTVVHHNDTLRDRP